MRFANIPVQQKNKLLMRLICFFWIVAKAISWKLWLSDRLFPLVPVFGLFVPSFVHVLLFIFSLATLLLLFILPTNRNLQIGLLTIEILSCLLDQNRWQPWEFQYFFLVLVFIINYKREKNIPAILGFILAAMYFYSGLSKVNPLFVNAVWYQIILTRLFHVSYATAHQPLVYHIGYLLAVIEIVLSIALFFKRTKKAAVILIAVMHLIILFMFGPWGINYDIIIWPWNIVLPICVYILFYNEPSAFSLKPLLYSANKLIIIFFGILPFLNLFGYWEYFFSSSLFSYRPPDMYIYIKNSAANKTLQGFNLKGQPLEYVDKNCYVIYVRDWAFREMLAPENPEIRIYKGIKEQLLKRYPGLDASFIIYSYSNGKRVKAELK